MDGKTVGDMYVGRMKKWKEAGMGKVKGGVKVGERKMKVVGRGDG